MDKEVTHLKGWRISSGMAADLGMTVPSFEQLEKYRLCQRRRSLYYRQDAKSWVDKAPIILSASVELLKRDAAKYDRILSVPAMLDDLLAASEAKLPAMLQGRPFLTGERDLKPETVEAYARLLLQCEVLASYHAALRLGGAS